MDYATRGQVEAALAGALVQFEKDHLGKGPADTRVLIVENMILIRLRGTLTHVEGELAQTSEGQALIKQLRMQMLENSRTSLEEIVMALHTRQQTYELATGIDTTHIARLSKMVRYELTRPRK